MTARNAAASKPEERFVELFQEVFGPAAAAKLEPQVHFRDIAGKDRYMDFALDSLLERCLPPISCHSGGFGRSRRR